MLPVAEKVILDLLRMPSVFRVAMVMGPLIAANFWFRWNDLKIGCRHLGDSVETAVAISPLLLVVLWFAIGKQHFAVRAAGLIFLVTCLFFVRCVNWNGPGDFAGTKFELLALASDLTLNVLLSVFPALLLLLMLPLFALRNLRPPCAPNPPQTISLREALGAISLIGLSLGLTFSFRGYSAVMPTYLELSVEALYNPKYAVETWIWGTAIGACGWFTTFLWHKEGWSILAKMALSTLFAMALGSGVTVPSWLALEENSELGSLWPWALVLATAEFLATSVIVYAGLVIMDPALERIRIPGTTGKNA